MTSLADDLESDSFKTVKRTRRILGLVGSTTWRYGVICRRDVLGGLVAATAAQAGRLDARQAKGLKLPGPYQSRTISVTVNRDHQEAYELASMPENVHKWASGLTKRPLERVNEAWIADTPEGRMNVRFAECNDFGVLDQYVTPPSGDTIYLPVRVVANGSGCEISLTLFRQPGVSDEQFARDADWVSRDLGTLKSLLES